MRFPSGENDASNTRPVNPAMIAGGYPAADVPVVSPASLDPLKKVIVQSALRSKNTFQLSCDFSKPTRQLMNLTLAIVGHLAGDFLLQSDWMANNKKQNSLACAVHCLLWTASVCAFSGCWKPLVVALLFATHFVQDRTQFIPFWMMRVVRQSQFASPPSAPWSFIVVDNVWHVVAIALIWRFVAGGTN